MARRAVNKALNSVANPVTVNLAVRLSASLSPSNRVVRQAQALQRTASTLANSPDESGRFAGHVLEKMCEMRGHDRVSAAHFVSAISALFKSVDRDFSAEAVVDYARHYGHCVRDQVDGRFLPASNSPACSTRTPSGQMPKWLHESEIHLRQNPRLSNGELAKAVGIDKSMFSKPPYKDMLIELRKKYQQDW